MTTSPSPPWLAPSVTACAPAPTRTNSVWLWTRPSKPLWSAALRPPRCAYLLMNADLSTRGGRHELAL